MNHAHVLSHVQPFSDPMDCNPPGSPSMEIFRQEYWTGLPFSPLGDLPDPIYEHPLLSLNKLREISVDKTNKM